MDHHASPITSTFCGGTNQEFKTGSLCSPGFTGTHSVDRGGFELRDPKHWDLPSVAGTFSENSIILFFTPVLGILESTKMQVFLLSSDCRFTQDGDCPLF